MTKDEFESVLGESVTDEQYKEIEYVYTYHPVVDCLGTIVKLYQIGGMRLMWDMDAAARQAQQIVDRRGVLKSQLNELSEEYQRLKKGEKNDDRSDYENG